MSEPDTAAPFSRRATAWIIGVCVVSVLIGIGFAIFGDAVAGRPSHRTDTTSPSAIGHDAFRRLLRELDIPVIVSRNAATRRTAQRGLLIVAEPYDLKGVRSRRESGRAMLLVLPKWKGSRHRRREEWVGEVRLLRQQWVQEVLETVAVDTRVVRTAGGGSAWRGEGPAPTLRATQLLTGAGIEPLIACDAGVLVGAVALQDRTCWVLSDPDVIATHGLGDGDNALLAVWLVNHLRGVGPVVFDETVHGLRSSPSIWRELFDFPLVLATMQTLLCVALLVWLGMVRFGAPLPPAPPHAAGKRFLIANTASLQERGGHSGYVLVRYLRGSLRTVAERLHVPAGGSTAEIRTTLERLGRSRGVATDLGALEDGVSAGAGRQERREGRARRIVAMAQRVHRWRTEMCSGS